MTPAQAAEILINGGVVALPTETVYGLAANAYDARAVSQIYRLKNRPNINPLIVHASSLEMAEKLAIFSPLAREYAKKYWPGPLTMILPLRQDSEIAANVVAGLQTIAIRIPNHPLFLEVLSLCKLPLAAPSANKSGYLSPTRPQDVLEGVPILDGGQCQYGLESTVVDMREKPIILRVGAISLSEARNQKSEDKNKSIISPGQMFKHYSPHTKLIINSMAAKEGDAQIIFGENINSPAEIYNLSSNGDLQEAAHNLFALLHDIDKKNYNSIHIATIPHEGVGIAINERLAKAAS